MTTRIALLVFLLASFASSQADTIAVYSNTPASWPKDQITLSFLDSETHAVLRSTELGTITNHNLLFGIYGPNKEFFYSVAPGARSKESELVVFSTNSFAEVARVPLGNLRHFKLNGGLGFVRVTSDGKHLVVLRKAKKIWLLEAYDRPGHTRVASTELPRKLDDGLLLPSGAYAATYPGRNKQRELQVVRSETGVTLASHTFAPHTKLRFEFSTTSDTLLVFAARKVAIEKRDRSHELVYGDVVYLHQVDIETGEKSAGAKLGYEATPLFRAANNQYDYFGARGSLKDEGLVVWRVDGSNVEKTIETDYLVSPQYALVSEPANRAVFFHKEKTIFVDLANGTVVAEDHLGIHPTSATLNATGTLAYLKQDLTSKVAVVDLQRDQAVEVSRAGSMMKKIGYGSAAVALSVGVASISGGFAPMFYPPPPDTSMQSDTQERFLYVINNQTNDVTVLDARSLKREKLINVKKPLLLARQRNGESIWAFGKDEIVLIDPNGNREELRLSEGVFAGYEEEMGRAYFANESGLRVVDTATGKVTHKVEALPNAYLVVN